MLADLVLISITTQHTHFLAYSSYLCYVLRTKEMGVRMEVGRGIYVCGSEKHVGWTIFIYGRGDYV